MASSSSRRLHTAAIGKIVLTIFFSFTMYSFISTSNQLGSNASLFWFSGVTQLHFGMQTVYGFYGNGRYEYVLQRMCLMQKQICPHVNSLHTSSALVGPFTFVMIVAEFLFAAAYLLNKRPHKLLRWLIFLPTIFLSWFYTNHIVNVFRIANNIETWLSTMNPGGGIWLLAIVMTIKFLTDYAIFSFLGNAMSKRGGKTARLIEVDDSSEDDEEEEGDGKKKKGSKNKKYSSSKRVERGDASSSSSSSSDNDSSDDNDNNEDDDDTSNNDKRAPKGGKKGSKKKTGSKKKGKKSTPAPAAVAPVYPPSFDPSQQQQMYYPPPQQQQGMYPYGGYPQQ